MSPVMVVVLTAVPGIPPTTATTPRIGPGESGGTGGPERVGVLVSPAVPPRIAAALHAERWNTHIPSRIANHTDDDERHHNDHHQEEDDHPEDDQADDRTHS
ncbi:hypothetical protein [Nocardia brasiliensis]|uniref:hypothetical protein n=1 Tax=Nocardia brasiliensis TaxID=37326 RepID=UPI0004A77962|nr:hypothetical protein [Nocardia brasiliensis]